MRFEFEKKNTWNFRPLAILSQGLIILTLAGSGHRHNTYSIEDLSQCTQIERMRAIPVIAYHPHGVCPRGIKERAHNLEAQSGYDAFSQPTRVILPREHVRKLRKHGFIAFEQEGPTCYLAAFTAAVSNLSLDAGEHAVSPVLMADAIAVNNGRHLDDNGDEIGDLNIRYGDIEHIHQQILVEGTVPISVDVYNFHEEYAFLRDHPDTFMQFVQTLLEDPNTQLILSFKTSDKMSHAVNIIGIEHISCTRGDLCPSRKLVISEPNRGSDGDKNFKKINPHWYSAKKDDDFAMLVDVNQGLPLFNSITVIRREDKTCEIQ